MCFKKWFGKEEEVVEEVPVERKPVDELVQSINDLVVQLNLVVEDNKKEKIGCPITLGEYEKIVKEEKEERKEESLLDYVEKYFKKFFK